MPEDKPESLELSLYESVSSSDLGDLPSDFADLLADDIPIPVFSTLRKIYRGGLAVRDYFYMKKVWTFLFELRDVSTKKRRDQLSKMLAFPEEQERFGEHIALTLDRLNDVSKASLMGRVSRAFIAGEISFDQLRSLDFAIDSVDPRLLSTLKALTKGSGASIEDQSSLARSGLMKFELKTESDTISDASGSHLLDTVNSATLDYTVSKLGRLFVHVCLN